MSPRPRPALTMVAPAPADSRLWVAYILLELVVVPVAVLLLALSSLPGEQTRTVPNPPANVNAHVLPLPPVSEPGAVLMVDPGRRVSR